MKKIFLFTFLLLWALTSVRSVLADSATDTALQYLRSKQDDTGRITTGFSAPSDWSAIAFAVNNIDTATVKSGNHSLLDFLLTDIPASPSAATDWESRILAIVALGGDPTNFNGVNYVSNLESFYNSNQIGDTCSLNDDVFGLLAEIAAGPAANTQIKQDTLNYLLTNEDPADGGFSYSAPGCSYYSTSADITGAALAALANAKNNGLTATSLDSAIASVSSYLQSNQDGDGGFGYFGTSDTDSTGWVLQGLNAAGLGSSQEAQNARQYLLSQQSATDGGITDYDYGTNTYLSNATTTAQALIALAGDNWVFKIFNPSSSIIPTVTVTPTLTPTPTPSSVQNTSNPTPTPTVLPSPTVVPTKAIYIGNADGNVVSPYPTAAVLGITTKKNPLVTVQYNKNIILFLSVMGLGTLCFLVYSWFTFFRKK